MRQKFVEHTVSILLVTAVFATLIVVMHNDLQQRASPGNGRVQEYVQLKFLDFGDPLQKALFAETLNIFRPDSAAQNDSLMQAIDEFRREQFTNVLYKTGSDRTGLGWSRVPALLGMYLQFILIYLFVLALSYYGAQTLGIIRFVQMKQGRASLVAEAIRHLGMLTERGGVWRHLFRAAGLMLAAAAKGVAYLILFAPAYVIAYSFKTKIETDSMPFMILLGVISNGLLITYANRFYTFLVAESRKGYVETAVVKNLHASFSWNVPSGIARKSVLRLRKHFPSHIFQHIYVNAQHQFHPTLKELASFLITGLVIIEMALNIQGHLSYEMLKNILYKQYDVVLAILWGIFLLVKVTEVAVDMWSVRTARALGDTV